MYDDCTDGPFDSHENRVGHSLREHWDINPKKYPHITGQDNKLMF